jgi:predicted transcriptional regulator
MVTLALAWIGTACWVVCFWWMHKISSRQDSLLGELNEMAQRIENLSRAEHELIQEVHPQVGAIKEHIETVAEAVTDDAQKQKR